VQTPVIFLTSENNAEKIHTVIRNGVDHVLVKPFNRSVVTRAISRVVQQNQRTH
jgi:DNA-binding response OmpR family regulator